MCLKVKWYHLYRGRLVHLTLSPKPLVNFESREVLRCAVEGCKLRTVRARQEACNQPLVQNTEALLPCLSLPHFS